MASTTRTRERMAHLRPVENGVGRVLQGCHAAAKILNVVEVVLDRLANDGAWRAPLTDWCYSVTLEMA